MTRAALPFVILCQILCQACGQTAPRTSARTSEHARSPCAWLSRFSQSIASQALPIRVHFEHAANRSTAEQVLLWTEDAWMKEVALGWSPPLSDRGACGPDDRFDVFVWRGFRAAESDAIAEITETAWDDRANYLVVDPWGPYGGAHLRGTLAHELNHAMQAAHDWNELPASFEMTAEFIEDQIDDDGNAYLEHVSDFQRHPEWSIFHNDRYETWFMYGASLYFFYLRDAIFGGDPRFAADVWRRARSPVGNNVPDFIDALDAILRERGSTFEESLIEFARWRWYTGAQDDGAHFEEGATFPSNAEVRIDAIVDAPTDLQIDPGIEIFGMSYVTVLAPAEGSPIHLGIEGNAHVRYVMQAVPSLRSALDADPLTDEKPLEFGKLDRRTVVIVALPADPTDRALGRTRHERLPLVLRLTIANTAR